ncbi:MAG: BON domain-containing protein [Proteobacteria bacterium]|nr:BON domain-containing protein [Pseudomonadota bacterium]
MYKKVFLYVLPLVFVTTGCAPVFVGAGAVGVYKVGTDERSAGRILDDSTITARVKSALAKAKDVKARKIDVDAVGGTVFLSGIVGTAEEAESAADIAGKVKGVKLVKSSLQVGKRGLSQAFGDSMTASKIKGQLMGEKGIRSLNIDVDVYNGVAILTGIVKTREQKERIMKITNETYGAVDIVDNLKIVSD